VFDESYLPLLPRRRSRDQTHLQEQFHGVLALQTIAAEFGKLRDFVESLGGHLEEGWRADVILRTEPTKQKHDVYFYTPGDTKRYNAKVSVQYSAAQLLMHNYRAGFAMVRNALSAAAMVPSVLH